MSDTDSEAKLPAQSASGANLGTVVTLRQSDPRVRPSEKAIAFAKEHPVLLVAGGVAAGLLVTALLPRRWTKGAVTRSVELAEAAGGAAMLFSRSAARRAQALGHDAGHEAVRAAHRAEKVSEAAVERLEKFGLAALSAASTLSRRTADRAEEFSESAQRRFKHDADELPRSDKIKTWIQDRASRIRR